MAMKLAILACFMTFIFSCTPQPLIASRDINWWCSQTPHPETCNFHLTRGHHNSSSSSSISRNRFLDLTVQAAIDDAVVVLDQTKEIEAKTPDGPEKVLWETCVEFCDGVIFRLNMTLDHSLKPSPLEIQTWLSAGLTYLQFCEKGFEMRNVTDTIFPSISTNLTQLISNSLAISVLLRHSTGFHSWTTSQDKQNLSGLHETDTNVVVAKDGSGNFKTIQEAVNAAQKRNPGTGRYVIYVKEGTYNEYVSIENTVKDVSIIGAGIGKTIISGGRHMAVENYYDLKGTATFQVWGDGFIARGITFRNMAGPTKGPAVAFASGSHRSALYSCSIEGYQDSLWTFSGQQFYRECQISGTVDFICGNALAVFQNCKLFFRKPAAGTGLVAACHARGNKNESTGYSIQFSQVMAADDLKPVIGQLNKAFLGRPWHPYAITVYMQSDLQDLLDPLGWDKSLHYPGSENTVYFGEYGNRGAGASTDKRVKWPGYHVIKDGKTAERFTAANFIEGHKWLPNTKVPWTPGLGNNEEK